MRPLLLLALPLLLVPVPAAAQPPSVQGATVLLFHPLDQVDPFGVRFADGDPFSVRYAAVAAQTGRFDYPVFVADGLDPIQALPDPGRPYQGTLEAYEAAVAARPAVAPLTLTLSAQQSGPQAVLRVDVQPHAPIQQSQGQALRLRVALAEDPVRYRPPAPVSNGVVDHRFTVRAYHDLGPIPLETPSNFTATIPLDAGWDAGRLLAAAWVQADGTPGRFAPTEVLQAAHTPLGGTVRQEAKGVLVEVYSATWCTPCLYGDLAAEQVAIRHAGAHPLPEPASRYFEAPPQPLLALAAAAVGALLVGLAPLPRGGRP